MEGNSIKSFENLCKIFETRIKLDRGKGIIPEDAVLSNYGKYAKKIDDIYNDIFAKEIKEIITPCTEIEDEEKRLEKLLSLLEGRLDKRHALEDRYYDATGEYLMSLQPIVSTYELNEKRDRLNLISKYLDTKREITNVTDDIAKMKNDLSEEEEKKEQYVAKNKIMEDELYSLFIGAIKNDDFYNNLNEDELDKKVSEAISNAEEAKETLDVTLDSVKSLAKSGMEDDYSSYVEDAEKNYYEWKNREITLKIYELVVILDDDFEQMIEKRAKINELVEERTNLKSQLRIEELDAFFEFEKALEKQINTLEEERAVLENINNYSNRISYKEERLGELEEDNNSPEMLTILREFGLVEVYDSEEEKAEEPVEEESLDISFDEESKDDLAEPSEEEALSKFIDPYHISEIKDYPKTLNIGLAKLKGESVREKVNKKLNPNMAKPTFEDLMIPTFDNKEEKEEPSEDNLLDLEKTSLQNDDRTLNEEEKVDFFEEKEESSNKLDDVMPVWDLPSSREEDTSNKLDIDFSNKQEEDTSNKLNIDFPNKKEEDTSNKLDIDFPDKKEEDNILPVWNVSPMFEEESSNKIPEKDTNEMKVNEETDNNFWIPASEAKLEANEFPSINIPIHGNFSSEKDNFGFPAVGGE